MREIVLIAKMNSKNGPEAFAEVTKALTSHGIRIVEAHQVPNRKELRKRVKGAVKSGHKLIAVIGGDGSQTAAVGEMAHSKAVLAVVPSGTGNSFAQTLGMAPTVPAAIDTILNGKVACVDLGVVNGTYFANFATIGLSAQIGLETPKLLKKIAGGIAYGLSAVVPVLRDKPFPATISWKRNKLDLETFQIIVANGRFFGNTPILPDADVNSGRLAFFTTAGTGRVDVMRMYLAFLNGSQTELPDAHYFQAEKIKIKTKGKQLIALDGSHFGYTPATFSVARNALRVMVPHDAEPEATP